MESMRAEGLFSLVFITYDILCKHVTTHTDMSIYLYIPIHYTGTHKFNSAVVTLTVSKEII